MRSALASLHVKLFPKKSYADWKRQYVVTTTYLGIANGTLESQNLARQIAEAENCGDWQLANSLRGLARCYTQIQEQPSYALVRRNNIRAARKMKELQPDAS